MNEKDIIKELVGQKLIRTGYIEYEQRFSAYSGNYWEISRKILLFAYPKNLKEYQNLVSTVRIFFRGKYKKYLAATGDIHLTTNITKHTNLSIIAEFPEEIREKCLSVLFNCNIKATEKDVKVHGKSYACSTQ